MIFIYLYISVNQLFCIQSVKLFAGFWERFLLKLVFAGWVYSFNVVITKFLSTRQITSPSLSNLNAFNLACIPCIFSWCAIVFVCVTTMLNSKIVKAVRWLIRGTGGVGNREIFFLPSPSPISFFCPIPTPSVIISTLANRPEWWNQRWCAAMAAFACPKISLHCRL